MFATSLGRLNEFLFIKLNAAIEFLEFRPSEIAAAAAVSVSISGETECIDDEKAMSNLLYVKQVNPSNILVSNGCKDSNFVAFAN